MTSKSNQFALIMSIDQKRFEKITNKGVKTLRVE